MSTSTHNTESPRPTDLLLVHDDAYAGWVFHASHPTQGRRFTNGADRIVADAEAVGLRIEVRAPRPATREELAAVHTSGYIAELLDEHRCDEWVGPRPDLAELAALFAGGTLVALDALLAGETRTAVHLPGAKHHAQADHSSGFCVLADFAMAARLAAQRGLRVAILDVDAHHGDGTENLTSDLDAVCTVSIHQAGIFPGTGLTSDPDRLVHNIPLPAGSGDVDLLVEVQDAIRLMRRIEPDLILLAAGADGHRDDPLSALGYTVVGYRGAARMVREAFPTLPILVGGAGGYRPDDATPEVWAAVAVETAARPSGQHAPAVGSSWRIPATA
jgi:acetoin utilization protein AcuC